MTLNIALPIIEQIQMLLEATGFSTMSRHEQENLFADLTDHFGRLIGRICWCYANGKDDYNDLRQDVLANIWRSLPRFRGESDWSTWIYRITLNTCVSTVRKSSRRNETALGDEALRIADKSDTSSEEDVKVLYSLIRNLTPIDRAIITLWLDEKPYEEIAQIMGMNRNSVATRLHRIKLALAKRWPE